MKGKVCVATVFLVFCGWAYSQVDVAYLGRLMNLPITDLERGILTNSPSGLRAYDPIGEVVAVIDGETMVRSLYRGRGISGSWSTNWGDVYLTLGHEYFDGTNVVRFERVSFLRHEADGSSVFLLKVKGREGFFRYEFKVNEDGMVRTGLYEVSLGDARVDMERTRQGIGKRQIEIIVEDEARGITRSVRLENDGEGVRVRLLKDGALQIWCEREYQRVKSGGKAER